MNKLLLSTAVATAMLLTACGSDKKASHPTPMPKAPTTTTDSQNQANSAGIGGVGKQDHVPSNSGITGSSGHSGSNASSSGSSGSTSSTGGTNAGGSSSSGGSSANSGSTGTSSGSHSASGSTGGTAGSSSSGSSGTTSGGTPTPPTSGSSGGSSSSGSSNSNSGSTGTSSGSNSGSGSTGGTNAGGNSSSGGSNSNSSSTGTSSGSNSGSGSTGTTSGSTTTPPTSGSSGTGSNAGGSSAGSSSGGSGSTGGTAGGATTPPTPPTTPTIADTKVDTSDWLKDIEEGLKKEKQEMDKGTYQITIDGKVFDPTNLNLKEFGQGFHQLPYVENFSATYQDKSKTATHEHKGTLYLFQQAYSAVGGVEIKRTATVFSNGSSQQTGGGHKGYTLIAGESVDTTRLPTAGQYGYTGQSHLEYIDGDRGPFSTSEWKQGNFEYTINFDTNKGKGRITESDGHVIELGEGDFSLNTSFFGFNGAGVLGQANSTNLDNVNTSVYGLALFGKEAQEAVGGLTLKGENKQGQAVMIEGYFGGKKQ